MLGIPRCHQASQCEREQLQTGLQGDLNWLHVTALLTSPQRLCREVIGWKHLTHPNILPLFGVSVTTESNCIDILTGWMPNGDLMRYAKSNPEANRLRLGSPLIKFPVFPPANE